MGLIHVMAYYKQSNAPEGIVVGDSVKHESGRRRDWETRRGLTAV